MSRHLVHSLLVHSDRFVQATLISVQPTEMEKCGYFGGLVSAWVFETCAVQPRASSVKGNGFFVMSSSFQQLGQVQVGHCVNQNTRYRVMG
jgi:hypothetical protein